MTKDNPTIIVNNKEMRLLEARLYWLELKLGIVKVKLSDEEKEDYTKWRDFRENRNKLAKTLEKKAVYNRVTERAYVAEKLGDKIESLSDQKYTKIHAHKPKKGSEYTPCGVEGAVTSYVCKKCGQVYEDNILHKPTLNPFRG